MALRDRINALNPETVISLENEFGIFWTGKAKFVFGAVRYDIWIGNDVKVICDPIKDNRKETK